MVRTLLNRLGIDRLAAVDLALAVATSALVWLAFAYGATKHFGESSPAKALLLGATQWDGAWYLRVARDGYSYDSEAPSSVAFFPLYPLVVRCLAPVLTAPLAAWVVSNVCFLGSMVLLGKYVRLRYPGHEALLSHYAVLSCCCFPPSFFFRAAYSESLLLLLLLLFLYGSERNARVWWLATVAGLATAARAVGIALVAPLLLDLAVGQKGSPKAVGRWLLTLVIAVSGLLAYMAYLQMAFGDPLAFAKAQQHWHARPLGTASEKLVALATLEPLWSLYIEDSVCYWRNLDNRSPGWFCLTRINPVFFVTAVICVGAGYAKRWLSLRETLLSAQLILIPYLLRAYETCMSSQGRFVAIVVPMYLVIALVAIRLPRVLWALLLAVQVVYLVALACLFAAQCPVL